MRCVIFHVLVTKMNTNLCTSADIVILIPVSHAYDILANKLYRHISVIRSLNTINNHWFSRFNQ